MNDVLSKEASHLRTIFQQQGRHALVALLLGAGLALPILSMLGLLASWTLALGTMMGAVLLICALSSFRAGKIILWSGIAAALVIWLTLLDGVSALTETVKAITMEYDGYMTASLYRIEITLLVSLASTLMAWFLTNDDLEMLFPTYALLLVAIIMRITGSEHWAITLVPGAAALLLLAAGIRADETPLRRVLPLILVLALFSGIVSLSGGMTIEPLHRAATDLRERIADYLFFTEPRNVFSLSAEGYYPQGPNQLGGTAEPNNRLVMIVETPRTTYLRGAIKNEYTGRAWYDTTGGRRYLWISPRWRGERDAAFNMSLPSEIIRSGSTLLAEQRVTVRIVDSSSSTMFVPQRVRTLSTAGDVVPYFNRGSEVFTTRDLQTNDVYTVTAPLMTAGQIGLGTIIAACASVDDPQYASIAATYTQLPDHMQEIVLDLAHDICEGAQSPYEKAFAIQNYLMRSYRYTLEVEPQPESIDFVTNFLFNTKEGYCTYFASAMTVLCRMVGLPARYVEGYLVEPDAYGVTYVTGRSGHAWTEVYFNGFGWLTFDATPQADDNAASQAQLPPDALPDASDEPTSTPSAEPESPDATPTPESSQDPQSDDSSNETPTPEVPPESSATPTPTPTPPPASDDASDSPSPDGRDTHLPGWLWWLLLVLLMLAASAVRIILTSPERLAARARTEAEAYAVWVQAVYDVLRQMGLRASPSESPIAFMRRADASGRPALSMTTIGRQISTIYYGKFIPGEPELALLRDAWQTLRLQLKPVDRIRLMLTRAFVPLRRRSFLSR